MINQQILRDRTKYFAIEVIKFSKSLTGSFESRIIIRQILRSCTSMAANYRAACRGRSKAEYYAKLCIVLEEADETLFWFEILVESEISDNLPTKDLLVKASELVKIFSAARKTIKQNLKT